MESSSSSFTFSVDTLQLNKMSLKDDQSLIQYRNLRFDEIPQVLELCRQEGRHMGQQAECQSWFQFDSKGFFVALNSKGLCFFFFVSFITLTLII